MGRIRRLEGGRDAHTVPDLPVGGRGHGRSSPVSEQAYRWRTAAAGGALEAQPSSAETYKAQPFPAKTDEAQPCSAETDEAQPFPAETCWDPGAVVERLLHLWKETERKKSLTLRNLH